MSIAAVILAGGGGTRLGGVNKALIDVGGMPLIAHAMRALSGCAPILVAVGRERFDLPDAATAIVDLDSDYGGPLAGVAAAVHHLRGQTGLLLSMAVDTPFFPRDFATRALPLIADCEAVIGAYGAQDYPTNALWRLEAISGLADEVRNGTAPHSLKRLVKQLKSTRLDYRDIVDQDPFRNANTPEDLAFLRQMDQAHKRA